MGQVAGKVLYTDGTVPHADICVIRFDPTEDTTAEIRKGATSDITPDGSFELFTRMPGDGVYDGRLCVTFAVTKRKGPALR